MKTSESIKEIAAALNKAQGEMVGAKKESANPFYKSTYSSLTDVMQAISKPFYDNGLCFVQAVENDNSMVAISTRIMHVSGEWIESTLCLPPVKNDPQAFGSAITYGKRYSLQALAGVPSVDDDGQFASASTQKHADETYNAVLELITANDIALVQVWSECDRNLQSTVWKMLTTAQKATAKELLDSVRKEK